MFKRLFSCFLTQFGDRSHLSNFDKFRYTASLTGRTKVFTCKKIVTMKCRAFSRNTDGVGVPRGWVNNSTVSA